MRRAEVVDGDHGKIAHGGAGVFCPPCVHEPLVASSEVDEVFHVVVDVPGATRVEDEAELRGEGREAAPAPGGAQAGTAEEGATVLASLWKEMMDGRLRRRRYTRRFRTCSPTSV